MYERYLLEIKELAISCKENNLSKEEIQKTLKSISSQSGISYEKIYKLFEEHLKGYH